MNPDDYLTVEAARDSLSEIVDLVQGEGEAVILTKDGKLAAVLISWDSFQRLTTVLGQDVTDGE